MNYDITLKTPPPMPVLGKGTEIVKLLLSQASKDMHEPLVPMLFPILGAHVKGVEFQYPDHTWKEMCGMMANLVADSGCNKGATDRFGGSRPGAAIPQHVPEGAGARAYSRGRTH